MSEQPLLRLEVGAVAHGGSCVARHEGRVIFVRHALPGELVLARLDRAGEQDRFWRADAVEVLRASPDRVERRCAVSGPGGCGGCDWQHASLSGQRRGKAEVVREQLDRLAGIRLPELGLPDVTVEPVPGDDDGLGWRTRVRFAVDEQGRPGLLRHRSHDVVPVPDCPLAHPALRAVGVGRRRWPGATSIELATDRVGPALVMVEGSSQGMSEGAQSADGSVPPPAVPIALARRTSAGLERVRGRTWVQEQVRVDGEPRHFRVTGAGFWQVHPGAAQTLLDAVLSATAPRPGERALDLYCGVGLFSAALAIRVGASGAVIGVESDPRACADARRSLHDLPQVELRQRRVEAALAEITAADPATDTANGTSVDVVVLDPPRSGAGRSVMTSLLALRPRVVAYVACDPAALARDLATAAELGYRLAGLRAFDLFPMTHHVECLATLRPVEAGHLEIS